MWRILVVHLPLGMISVFPISRGSSRTTAVERLSIDLPFTATSQNNWFRPSASSTLIGCVFAPLSLTNLECPRIWQGILWNVFCSYYSISAVSSSLIVPWSREETLNPHSPSATSSPRCHTELLCRRFQQTHPLLGSVSIWSAGVWRTLSW